MRLLAVPSRKKLARMLKYVFDESEFLSPHGVRSLSKFHKKNPLTITIDGKKLEAHYTPGESDTPLFGGNSNWRGPVWFPLNYLLIEALERYHHFYGGAFVMEYPSGSGEQRNLKEIADDLSRRLVKLFGADEQGRILFYEYFHGDTGKGLGANHQTGWTALIVKLIENLPQDQKRDFSVEPTTRSVQLSAVTKRGNA
jgi:glycogen debranching enzyme